MALARQLDIPLAGAEAQDALHYWADSLAESRGEVFTKTEVVEFILDLVGWQVGQTLRTKRLLEPSCGSGDFVVPAVRRLLTDAPHATVGELLSCIRAVKVNRAAFALLVQRVRAVLQGHGFSTSDAEALHPCRRLPLRYHYPHHNLYYLTSETWDLRALQTILRSNLANAFVATYSLRMRGDCLRFQAQYLRRIRLPEWTTLSETHQAELIAAATADQDRIDTPVREVYGLDTTEWAHFCDGYVELDAG